MGNGQDGEDTRHAPKLVELDKKQEHERVLILLHLEVEAAVLARR